MNAKSDDIDITQSDKVAKLGAHGTNNYYKKVDLIFDITYFIKRVLMILLCLFYFLQPVCGELHFGFVGCEPFDSPDGP